MTILQTLESKRVGVRILNLGMDTQPPTGKLMLAVLGGVAQFEPEMMLERQREGIGIVTPSRKRVTPDASPSLRTAAQRFEAGRRGPLSKSCRITARHRQATVYRFLAAQKAPTA